MAVSSGLQEVGAGGGGTWGELCGGAEHCNQQVVRGNSSTL